MNSLHDILSLLENYNALIKYYIKAHKEGISDERKINFNLDNISSIEEFCSDIRQILHQGNYLQDFVYLVYRLYLVCESNSDLFATHAVVEKQLNKLYPVANTLEKFSFGIYEFIRNEILYTDTEYPEFDNYPLSEMTEFIFKDDEAILWKTYYLLLNVTDAYLMQEKQDIEHQLSFKSKPDKDKFIQQQNEIRAEEIINLSNGFCDKNLPFSYIRHNPMISKENLFYLLLSEVLSKTSSEEYTQYVELDYSKYRKKNYQWNFESKTLDSYTDLYKLFGFNRLVQILANALLIKDYTEETTTQIAEEPAQPIENKEEFEEYLDRRDKELNEEIKHINKIAKPEYILPVPILDLIYQEFDDELWDNITLIEFLDMFTTKINTQENFKLKPKQTARFYYLLKKMWLNSSNKSLFAIEKEWVIPFLQHYDLSYSAYTNQFIKNEGGVKHRQFIKSVDKILPKDEIQ